MGKYWRKVIIVLLFGLWGQLVMAANVIVTVVALKPVMGTLLVALCDKQNFMVEESQRNCVYQEAVPLVLREKYKKLVLTNIGPGEYVLAIIHDENNNSELDSNVFGMPVEGYGFSGLDKPIFGAPNFDLLAFQVDDTDTNVSLEIKMHY